MSAETAIQGQIDRIAKGRQTQQTAFATGGGLFWTRVDAAQDMPYENRVKGSDITALDVALTAGAFWSAPALARWAVLHNSYFQTDLGLAAPFIEKYLTSKGWRVPYEFAQAWYEATGTRISPQFVFGKGTRVASGADPSASGMQKIGTWAGTATWAVVDGALVNCLSPILVTSTDATPGGTSPVLTVTLSDNTTVDVGFTPSATQYGQVIVGQQAIGAAGAAAGQKVIPMAATGQFKANTWALVCNAAMSTWELIYIASIVLNTSITTTTNLINSYVQNDLVQPLCSNATYKSGSITSGKNLAVWAWPDRIIAI